MPYRSIDPTRYAGDMAADETLFDDIVKNGDYLFGQLGSLPQTIQNGSFEVDSDGNGQPDDITCATFPGGQVILDATSPAEGSQCLKMAHPGGAGAGGGSAEFDYVPCSELRRVVIGWVHWVTAAGMHNQVVVEFFDKGKIHISDVTVYDSATNPTVPTYFVGGAMPPANARFFKVKLIGGQTDVNVAGTAYFDAVKAFPPDGKAGFSLTIAQYNASAGPVWTDVQSVTLALPYCNIPVVITALGDLSVGGIDPYTTAPLPSVKMRLRVGTSYSSEIAVAGSVRALLSLPLPTGTDPSQLYTIYMQVASDYQTGVLVTASISDTSAAARIDP